MRFQPAHIALAAFTALALALPPAASAKSVAGVRVTDCQTAAKPSQRSATFHAHMSAIPETGRMSMRFVLLQKTGSKKAPLTRAPLKSLPWHSSHRGVKHFGFSQKVTKLEPGGSYRVRVQFRWSGGAGHLLLRTRRTSGACAQGGGLPNLRVTSVTISPGSSDAAKTYNVTVDNAGKGVAQNFAVALIVDGALVDTTQIDRLDTLSSRTVTFSGQPCNRLRAVVDYTHSVRETNESDNVLSTTC